MPAFKLYYVYYVQSGFEFVPLDDFEIVKYFGRIASLIFYIELVDVIGRYFSVASFRRLLYLFEDT